MSGHVLRLKEEEEPLEVDVMTQNQPVIKENTHCSLTMPSHHLFTVKTENQSLTRNKPDHPHPGAKMVDQCNFGLKAEDRFSACNPADCFINTSNSFQFQVKLGDSETAAEDLLRARAKMADLCPIKAEIPEKPFAGAKMSNTFFSAIKEENNFQPGAMLENGLLSGAKMAAQVFSGAKTEEQLLFGAKMEDQCIRAVLWQDMSVNLASKLLHQLSGKQINH